MMVSKTKIGDKYNDLLVIGEPFTQDQYGYSKYFALVECNCGNQFTTTCTKLRNNVKKRCHNCSFKLREEAKPQVGQLEQNFNRLIRHRCIAGDIEFKLNMEEYENIVRSDCYYCNEPPPKKGTFNNRKHVNTEDLYVNGIDRLNPQIGYFIGNCVPCCTSCNYAKHILSEKEFIEKIIKIYNNFMRKGGILSV